MNSENGHDEIELAAHGGRREGAGRPRKPRPDSKPLPPFPKLTDKKSVQEALRIIAELTYNESLTGSRGRNVSDIIISYMDVTENVQFEELQERLESLLKADTKQKQRKQQKP